MAIAARGDRVGKYEILTALTSGGMAELFLGATVGQGGFQKHVVIKRILPDASRDETFVRMFLDEARITAGFSHPNIAQTFDLGEDENGLYVVMEFIPGQNLNQVISACAKKQEVLPLGFSVSVLNDCALALHYAHTYVKPSGEPYPVVHRDVAQKNIMVAWDGQTRLLDFGIAKAANTLSRTKVGTVKGTAGYMSPEQVTGGVVDGRSDVFSLGVVLWEMVTGQRLFSADTELAEMKLIVSGVVQRPDEVEPVVPEELSQIIMKALAREPADRWNSARDFSRALAGRVPELLFDAEQKSQFMRELFSDRIEQTRKLFEAANTRLSEAEMQALARALQESAMSQSALQPVTGPRRVKARPAPAKAKKRTAEDDRLIELALRVDAVAVGAAQEPPRRTWTGPLLLLVALVLGGLVVRQVVFTEPRVTSSGLQAFPGEPDEEPVADPSQPTVKTPATPIDLSGVPGAESNEPAAEAPASASPIALPPPSTKEPDSVKTAGAGRSEAKVKAQGEVSLALLPEATVFRGAQQLGTGSWVTFSLPIGTHLLTVIGRDGLKRLLSLPVLAGKNKTLKLRVDELPVR